MVPQYLYSATVLLQRKQSYWISFKFVETKKQWQKFESTDIVLPENLTCDLNCGLNQHWPIQDIGKITLENAKWNEGNYETEINVW